MRDGADDQDHDDLPNLMELSRSRRAGGSYFSADVDPTKGGCSVDPDLTTDDLAPDGNGVPDIEDNGNHWTAYGRVNPFNPCLPSPTRGPACAYTEFGSEPAPFDGSPNWIAATSRAPAAPEFPEARSSSGPRSSQAPFASARRRMK